MSRTTAFFIHQDGHFDKDAGAVLPNSWGFAPYVWTPLCKKYLGEDGGWGKTADRLWALWNDPRLSRAERCALLCTFDYAIVERERFVEVAALLREFVSMQVGYVGVNHWPAIANALDRAAYSTEKWIGFCLWCTSVSENVWSTYDEKTDTSSWYDIKTGDKHLFVGAALDKPMTEAP